LLGDWNQTVPELSTGFSLAESLFRPESASLALLAANPFSIVSVDNRSQS
jgi:hypothetical protein